MIIDAHAHVLSTNGIGELAHGRPFSDERMDYNYTYFVPGYALLIRLSIASQNASPASPSAAANWRDTQSSNLDKQSRPPRPS